MGYLFSKPVTITQRLLQTEQTLAQTESSLKHFRSLRFRLILVSLLSLTHIPFRSYLNVYITSALYILLLAIYTLLYFIIHFKNRKIESLKILQKKNIETLMTTNQFNEIKSIVDKYNKPALSKSVFKALGEFVLDDVSDKIALICKKCGEHNGNVEGECEMVFKCKDCKTVNKIADYRNVTVIDDA